MQIRSIMDLLIMIDEFKSYLDGKIEFDSEGWPIFKREHFLNIWPEYMITYQNRKNKMVVDKSKTLLCFYSKDSLIYPRVYKLLDEVKSYKDFLGAVAADITVTYDMDIELQHLIILSNQLFMAVLAVNEIKIVLNTRNGSYETANCFRNIPKGVMCSSGFLGCKIAKNYWETSEYINKILRLRPSQLVIYGKQDKLVEERLDDLGIDYKRFDDFRRISGKKVA